MSDSLSNNQCWRLSCVLSVYDAIAISDYLDEYDCTVSCFEDVDNNNKWHLHVFTASKEALEQVESVIYEKFHEFGIKLKFKIEQLDDIDWVDETQKRFKPFSVGRFYIHSSYYKDDKKPNNLIPIEIDAKMSFGTGEHETTSGCLMAISELSGKKLSPKSILDMGCGSAILTIAAGKIWSSAQLVAVDINHSCVDVAKENLAINNITNPFVLAQSEGYAAKEIKPYAPYDLILCNILATPLINMSSSLKRNLKSGGTAVLSGLLKSQENDVREAHEELGLELKNRYALGQWITLVYKK